MATTPFDYASYLSSIGPPSGGGAPYSTTMPYDNPYGNDSFDWATSNPSNGMRQDRGYFANWGAQEGQNLSAQQAYEQELQGQYGGAMNQMAGTIGNNPGYTPTEMSNIVNPAAYEQGMTTPDQYASLAPTQAEQTAMEGNPGSYGEYLNPALQQLASNDSTQNNSANTSINNTTQWMNNDISQEGNSVNTALSNGNLTPTANYYNDLADTYNGTAAQVKSAVNSPNLQLQLNPNQYIMSNGEVQGMENQAAQAVNLSSQQQMSQIRQAAMAAGNSDPMALAALQNQYNTTEQENAANAVTSAQIQAEDAQRQTEMGYAQAALGAGQTQSQMQMSGALASGQMGENTYQTAENTNLSAAQYLASQQASQANIQANQGLSANQWTGQQGIGTAEDFGNMYQNALEYGGTEGTNVAETQDQAAAQRAAELYGIRQGNTQYQQGQTYGQNFNTQSQLSNLYQAAANARMAGQNEFLGWATGQTNQANESNLNLNQQQIGTAGVTFPNMNQATGQWGNYTLGQYGQSWGGQFQGALMGGLSTAMNTAAKAGVGSQF